MPIKHDHCTNTIKITHNGAVIETKWNFFDTIDDATDYIKNELLVMNPNGTYGFVQTKMDYWTFMPTPKNLKVRSLS